MQPQRHKAFLDSGQVVTHFVQQEILVDVLEAHTAHFQFLVHTGDQLLAQVQFIDFVAQGSHRPVAGGLVGSGFGAFDQLAQLQQVVVELCDR